MAAAIQLNAVGALFGALPNFSFNCMFGGIGPSIELGPQQIAAAVQSMAASVRATAAEHEFAIVP
jgi:hypothetical protein